MENYTLVPNTTTQKNYILVTNAPYLLSTLTVSITATAKSISGVSLGVSTPLVLGVDYYPAFLFNQATASLKVPVYAGISFTDPLLAGALEVSYQPIGYGYSITSTQINAVYANSTIDPVITLLEDAVPGLVEFPVIPTLYNAETQSKLSDVSLAVAAITTAIATLSPKTSIFNYANHINDTHNPHFDTALEIGLGNVPNWTVGTSSDILAGTATQMFVTPASVANSTNLIVPAATSTVLGTAALNLGNAVGDATNNTDALTANGLVYMLVNNLLPVFSTLRNNQRNTVSFSPKPIVYPTKWNNVICNNFSDLVIAVQDFTHIYPLTHNAATASIVFPHSITPPSLVLTVL